MTRNKNRLFGRHFETVQHFNFSGITVFDSAYILMVQIVLQNWAPTGVKVPWSLKRQGYGKFSLRLFGAIFNQVTRVGVP